jgi:hypothetical protein
MLKATFKNILLFILLKYLIFILSAMIFTGNYKLLEIQNIKTAEDLFYYLWLLLFFPVVAMIFFSCPLYFSFRIKSHFLFVFCIAGIFLSEYLVYVYFTSAQYFNRTGVLNLILSFTFFFFLFHREILNIRNKSSFS